jgi:hypothetical protein
MVLFGLLKLIGEATLRRYRCHLSQERFSHRELSCELLLDQAIELLAVKLACADDENVRGRIGAAMEGP